MAYIRINKNNGVESVRCDFCIKNNTSHIITFTGRAKLVYPLLYVYVCSGCSKEFDSHGSFQDMEWVPEDGSNVIEFEKREQG